MNEENKLVKLLLYLNWDYILLLSLIIIFFILVLNNKIDGNALFFVAIGIIVYLVLKFLLVNYLNFIAAIRNTGVFPDNRTANFLTFDMLKFVLILVSLSSVIILGLNRVLENETIATLLGGLIGSLLTMKGSYTDQKIDKDLIKNMNQDNPDQQMKHTESGTLNTK